MSILKLLASDNFITVNKELLKVVGIEASLLLGELISESNYWEKENALEDGFFYSTTENIKEKTTLSIYKQQQAIQKLKDLGLIDTKLKGVPAKRYFKILEQPICDILNIQFAKNSQTSLLGIHELDCEKTQGNKNITKKKKETINISKETKAKKSLVEQIMDEYPVFVENSDLRQTYLDFAEMRKNKKKPLSTERMIRLSINRVIDRGNGDVTKMIGLLEEAIEGCWDKVWSEEDKNKTSVYPAKKTPKNEGTKDWDNMLNALEEGRLNSAESLSNTGNVVAIPANTKDTVDILDLFKDEGEIIL